LAGPASATGVARPGARYEAADGAFAQLRKEPLTSLVDEVAQGAERNRTRLRLELFGDDECEGNLGLVLLARIVDDLHVLARPDHFGDLEQGDISAVARIVELAIRVPFDDASRALRSGL